MRLTKLMALFLFAAVAGCSAGKSAIEGTVTYDGEPIAVGSIVFMPTAGQGIKVGDRIVNGRFKVAAEFGATSGPHRVEIHWDKPTGQKYKNEFGDILDRRHEGLPDKYHTNSTLTAVIKPGTNVIEFNLEK